MSLYSSTKVFNLGSSISVKGSLQKNVQFWESISAPENIVCMIKYGYKLPFMNTPNSAYFKNNVSAFENDNFVSESIRQLVKLGSVIETNYIPHVVSPLSVASNAAGKRRLILDLRYINSHLYKEYIKFDDWHCFEHFLKPNSFAYKFDLKQGYHHVDIFPAHQTFLGFSWNVEGRRRHYVFTVLAFGLSSAPYLFTKLLRPLVRLWRSFGVQICVYLDDGIGTETSQEKAKVNSAFVKETLARAGFVTNEEKSVWKPSSILTWIGISMDLKQNILFIPDSRVDSIGLCISNILTTPYTSARKLAELTGKLISTKYVVGDIISLKTRYMYKLIEGRSSWDARLNILNFPEAHNEIIFWKNNFVSLNIKPIKDSFLVDVVVSSDASATGIGVVASNALEAHRSFNDRERSESSTWREIMAILYGLKSFFPDIRNKNISWKIDNYAASRIVKVGSRNAKLQDVALEIHEICFQNNINLKVTWIPREFNTEADKFSKYVDVDSWEITKEFFQFLDNTWGPFTIDRFADSDNCKLPRFNSKFSTPHTEAVDAFLQDWGNDNNLLVPPIKDIPLVLDYVKKRKVLGTLVIPLWESASYWPLLCSENGQFCYFVKDFLIFDNPEEVLQPGPCPFALLGSRNFRGNLIALKVCS